MKKILVDTNIIIDFSKVTGTILEDLLAKQISKEVELYINPVVVAEFFADRNLRRKEQYKTAEKLFRRFSIIDITKEIGLMAGALVREQKVISVADSLIAATCLLQKLTLVTRNVKDFKNVPHLAIFLPDDL